MQSKNTFNKVQVWGILNCTPDSFFDGKKERTFEELQQKVKDYVLNKVDVIDIGGQSTRPGAEVIDADNELKRILPIVKWIKNTFPSQKISIDTFYASVAEACLKEGVQIINDISAASNIDLLNVVKKYACIYVLMHNNLNHSNELTRYPNGVLNETIHFFAAKIKELKNIGIQSIIIDPGFGFAKTLDENYILLSNLERFSYLGFPILIGISRKSMMYKLVNKTPKEVLPHTTALHLFAIQKNASILRVHDVEEANDVIKIAAILEQFKAN
jgi:dihydropteroate synthase